MLNILRVLIMLMCWSIDKAVIQCVRVVFTAVGPFPVFRVFRERRDLLDLQVWWDLRWVHMSQTTHPVQYIDHCGCVPSHIVYSLYRPPIETLNHSFSLACFRGTLEKLDQWEKEVTQDLQDHLESKVYQVQLAKKGQRSDFDLQPEIFKHCGSNSSALQRIEKITYALCVAIIICFCLKVKNETKQCNHFK